MSKLTKILNEHEAPNQEKLEQALLAWVTEVIGEDEEFMTNHGKCNPACHELSAYKTKQAQRKRAGL